MDKFKFLLVVIIIFIFAEGAGLIYFAHRSQKLKETKPGIERVETEKGELEKKYEELLLRFKAIEKDRNNLLVQTKRLFTEREKFQESEANLEKLQTARKLFDEQKADLNRQIQELQSQTAALKAELAKAKDERDQLKEAYEKSKGRSDLAESKKTIKKLKKEIADLGKREDRKANALRKEYQKQKRELKKAENNIEKLKKNADKKDKKIAGLRTSLDEYKEIYLKAKKKNEYLTREARNIPKKFSEMARQNKKLVKETAQMHYNLGVFYTKNKEYKRAIAEFKKAAEIDPEDPHAHFNLGYIYAEYLVDRKKAIEHFRHYLRYAKSGDKDVNWVRKYLLTWETFEGKGLE